VHSIVFFADFRVIAFPFCPYVSPYYIVPYLSPLISS
jgi:hypothetical protein